MGSKQIRLEEDVYAKIADKKREGETFSEAIDRLTSDWSLAEWGGWMSEEEAREHRKLLEEIEEADKEKLDGFLKRMDGPTE